jgi:hypothetical protein
MRTRIHESPDARRASLPADACTVEQAARIAAWDTEVEAMSAEEFSAWMSEGGDPMGWRV